MTHIHLSWLVAMTLNSQASLEYGKVDYLTVLVEDKSSVCVRACMHALHASVVSHFIVLFSREELLL